MSYVRPNVWRRCQCTIKYPGFLDSRQGHLMYFYSAVIVFADAADMLLCYEMSHNYCCYLLICGYLTWTLLNVARKLFLRAFETSQFLLSFFVVLYCSFFFYISIQLELYGRSKHIVSLCVVEYALNRSQVRVPLFWLSLTLPGATHPSRMVKTPLPPTPNLDFFFYLAIIWYLYISVLFDFINFV